MKKYNVLKTSRTGWGNFIHSVKIFSIVAFVSIAVVVLIISY